MVDFAGQVTYVIRYSGKFVEFGKSFVIFQTKTIQVSSLMNNPLVDLFIRQTFFPLNV